MNEQNFDDDPAAAWKIYFGRGKGTEKEPYITTAGAVPIEDVLRDAAYLTSVTPGNTIHFRFNNTTLRLNNSLELTSADNKASLLPLFQEELKKLNDKEKLLDKIRPATSEEMQKFNQDMFKLKHPIKAVVQKGVDSFKQLIARVNLKK